MQGEQNRVYQQNQQLLQSLNNPQQPSQADVDSPFQGEQEISTEPPYPYKQTEDEVIKYICKKIVAMREQPIIDAVDNLKRA
jgi:hypothetical protein